MIPVMPGVMDRYVPEETAVCPQDIVHPGTYLPPQPDHNICPLAPGPGMSVQKKMYGNILLSHRRQGLHNLFVLLRSFRPRKVSAGVACHHNFGPTAASFKILNCAIDSQGVFWGEVAPGNIPFPT